VFVLENEALALKVLADWCHAHQIRWDDIDEQQERSGRIAHL
jgi:hypothetical protein